MISDINSFIKNVDDDSDEHDKILKNSYKNHMFGGKENEENNKNKVKEFLNGSEKYENINNKNLLFYLCYLINPYTKSKFRSEINNYNDNLNLISYNNVINKDILSIKNILTNNFYEEMIEVINLIDKQEPDNQNVKYLYLTDNEYLNSDENNSFCKNENCSTFPTLDNINDGRIFCNEGYYDEYKDGNCICVKHFDNIIDTIGKIVSKEGRSFLGTLNASVIPDHQLDDVVRHLLKLKKYEVKRELNDEEIASITNSIKSSSKIDVIKRFIEGFQKDNKDIKNFKKVKKIMGGMKFKYNAKDIFNMDINATKEINTIYNRLSKLSQYDICNMKKNNFINYLLDDVVKINKSEQKGGYRYAFDKDKINQEIYSLDESLLPEIEQLVVTTLVGPRDVNKQENEQRSNNIKKIHNNSIEYLLERYYDFDFNYNNKLNLNIVYKKNKKKFELQDIVKDMNIKEVESDYLNYFLFNNIDSVTGISSLSSNRSREAINLSNWKFMIEKKKGLLSLGYKGIYRILDFLIMFKVNFITVSHTLKKQSFTSVEEKKIYLKNELLKYCDKERYSINYRIWYNIEEYNLIKNYIDSFLRYFEIIFIDPVVEKMVTDNKNFTDDDINYIKTYIKFFENGDLNGKIFEKGKYQIIKDFIQNNLEWNIKDIGLTEENYKYYNDILTVNGEILGNKNLNDEEKYFYFLRNMSKECNYPLYQLFNIHPTIEEQKIYCVFKKENDNDGNWLSYDYVLKNISNKIVIKLIKIIKFENNEIMFTYDDSNNIKLKNNDTKYIYPLNLFLKKKCKVKYNNNDYYLSDIRKYYKVLSGKNKYKFYAVTEENQDWRTFTGKIFNFNDISIKFDQEYKDELLKKKPKLEHHNIVAYYDFEKFRWDVIETKKNNENNKYIGESLYYENVIYNEIDINYVDTVSSALEIDPYRNVLKDLIKNVLNGNDNYKLGLQVNIIILIFVYNTYVTKIIDFKLINDSLFNDFKNILNEQYNKDKDDIISNDFILNYKKSEQIISKVIQKNKPTDKDTNTFFKYETYIDNYLNYNIVTTNNNAFTEYGDKKDNILIPLILQYGSYKYLYQYINQHIDPTDHTKYLYEFPYKLIQENIKLIDTNNFKDITKVLTYYNAISKDGERIKRHSLYLNGKLYSLYDLAGYKDENKLFIYNDFLITNLHLFDYENENEYNFKTIQEKYLNLSLLDVACEFGNFELAYKLVKEFNFDYEKEDIAGIKPYMRAFASIYQNGVDNKEQNSNFIRFFEAIEEKIKEKHKDSNETINNKIRELYNWNIPYFSIVNNSNNAVSTHESYKSFYDNPYFKTGLVVSGAIITGGLLFGGITIVGTVNCAIGVSAYIYSFVTPMTITVAGIAAITSGGIIYYFNLENYILSKNSLNPNMILDQEAIKRNMDSIGFQHNIEYSKIKNISKEISDYNKNIHDILTSKNDMNEKNKDTTIYTINGIDISTIYVKYYELVNSNPLYFVTKHRNKVIFDFYNKKLNDYNENNKLIFYKTKYIDYFIFEQAINSVYKCIQPNFCFYLINMFFSKYYIYMKEMAIIEGKNQIHSFVSFITDFSPSWLSFIIHFSIEIIGTLTDIILNNKEINIFQILKTIIDGLIRTVGYSFNDLFSGKIFHIVKKYNNITIILAIFYGIINDLINNIYKKQEILSNLLNKLTNFVQGVKKVTTNKDIIVNDKTSKITVAVKEVEELDKYIEEQFKKAKLWKEEKIKNENLYQFNISNMINISETITNNFFGKKIINILFTDNENSNTILQDIDDKFIDLISKKIKLYRGENYNERKEIPITECYNGELVKPFVINFTEGYKDIDKNQLIEYFGYSNSTKENAYKISMYISDKYKELQNLIKNSGIDGYKDFELKIDFYDFKMLEYKMRKISSFFSIKSRIKAAIKRNNQTELKLLAENGDLTEYLLSGDDSWISWGSHVVGYNPIHYIIQDDDIEILKILFENTNKIEKAKLLCSRTLTRKTLMHVAIYHKKYIILDYLLGLIKGLSNDLIKSEETTDGGLKFDIKFKNNILLRDEINNDLIKQEKNFFKMLFLFEDKYKLTYYDYADEKSKEIIRPIYAEATGDKEFKYITRISRLGLKERKYENDKIKERGSFILIRLIVGGREWNLEAEYINYDKDTGKVNIEILSKSKKELRITSILEKDIIKRLEENSLTKYNSDIVKKILQIKIIKTENIDNNNFNDKLKEYNNKTKNCDESNTKSSKPDCDKLIDTENKEFMEIHEKICNQLKSTYNTCYKYYIKIPLNKNNKDVFENIDINDNINKIKTLQTNRDTPMNIVTENISSTTTGNSSSTTTGNSSSPTHRPSNEPTHKPSFEPTTGNSSNSNEVNKDEVNKDEVNIDDLGQD